MPRTSKIILYEDDGKLHLKAIYGYGRCKWCGVDISKKLFCSDTCRDFYYDAKAKEGKC